MPKIKLAAYTPCNEGTPKINAPSVYGASANKPFLYRIPTVDKKYTFLLRLLFLKDLCWIAKQVLFRELSAKKENILLLFMLRTRLARRPKNY